MQKSRLLLALVVVTLLVSVATAQVQTWKHRSESHGRTVFRAPPRDLHRSRSLHQGNRHSAIRPGESQQTVIDASIDANSIDTRVEMRDNDLRSPTILMWPSSPHSPSNQKRSRLAMQAN